LEPSDFYVVDDHLNPQGQRKVGETLARIIRTHHW
jgi:hypothetical protein